MVRNETNNSNRDFHKSTSSLLSRGHKTPNHMLSEEEQKSQARNHNAIIPPSAFIPHTGCTSGRTNSKASRLMPLPDEVPRPPAAATILSRKKLFSADLFLYPFPGICC